MSTLSGGPNIVTNGLVLSLDAANVKSYVSGSTTWNDLSRGGNNGTILNGPTFNNANGGSIVFDGTNDYVVCGNASNLQITVGSISAWVRTFSPGSGYRSIIAKQNAWGLFVKDSILIAYDWANAQDRSTGINISDNTWKYVAMTFTQTLGTPSNNAVIYFNGNPVLTTTVQHSANNVAVQIAEANANQYLNGSIAFAQVYNRTLSATEVLQNYNATKARFGL